MFRIIKLTNNDDPKEFTLEITRMRDIRQRIGIIEAGYLDYLELKGRRKHKPSYNILAANDYSFYTVFRGDFDSYNECKQKRDELYDYYNKKAMNEKRTTQTLLVLNKFIVYLHICRTAMHTTSSLTTLHSC